MIVYAVYSLIFIRKSGARFEFVGFILFLVTTVLFCLVSPNITFIFAYILSIWQVSFVIAVVENRDLIYCVAIMLIISPSLYRYFQKG